MITSIQAIQKLTNDIISLIQSGKLNATYHQSKNTVSFYVNDIDTGAQKRLTLRVSDHHPTLQRYVKKNNDLPNYTNNLSIEFYKPVYLSSGKRKPNKTNRRVRVPSLATKLSDFSVSIYNYKPQYLDPVDITTIYNAILKWFSDTTNNPDAKYIDPFKGTPKAATTSAPISKLRENKQYRDMKQKQVIKLNESQLRCMIKKMIMEGLYNEYSGNDLNYDSIKMQADSCIAKMIANGEEISWKEVAKNMGFRLETLNYDDLELMKSAIEDAMLEDEKINENSNKMKQKQTIKLKESQLRGLIKESIKNVLNETSTRDMLHKAIPNLSNDKLESDLVGATSKYMNMDSYGKDGDISLLMGHNSDKLRGKKKQSDASWKAYDRAATLAKTNRELFGNDFSDLDRNLNTDDDRAHARDYTTYNDMFLDMNESKLKKAIRESIKKVLKESETPIVIGDEDSGDLYSVTLSNGDYSSVVFNVYCYSAQDALDEAVDYAENQGWNGLFDDENEEEINEFPDDYITAGNHGHYLRIDNFVVRKV